jgi:AraC-like DNA-binding protein
MLLTYCPRPPLSRYVEALWHFDGHQPAHAGKERVLPNGRFQVVIDLSDGPGVLCGMRSQYIAIEPAAMQSIMGVVFRPGGARGFFAGPSIDFYNQIVPLDALWGPKVAQLQERLRDVPSAQDTLRALETALLDAVQQGDESQFVLHGSVECALRAFRRTPHIQTVSEVARDAGLSRRRLTQLFAEQIGMTPKRYCRLMRFRRVVREIAGGGAVNWADVALAGGYCDQAHLAHEFRTFSGLSPSRYLEAERPFPNHVRVG